MSYPKHKIILSTQNTFFFIEEQSILYCKSNNCFTTFYLENGEEITVSCSIKKVEKLLDELFFVRIHQSFIINVNHISRVHKATVCKVLMRNGELLPISSRRKRYIMQFLHNSVRIQIP
ncbi:LytTR family DNA-binding domain-containing protein [Carboxylicivirga sp. M1479]|uniref:LytR/AlgR family response regulator transcription factor n=1 Tax=Carboxylicivirga sp. M1479 TaxID=2594476 RepID=UPI001177E1C5|nr:LytTR family DNA-binding domain-containing protein [Carboxylicivirga sp. M1479]TRX71310.1 LytTR family transcriptional regulator [Carboxylicivirga sp. M1479]